MIGLTACKAVAILGLVVFEVLGKAGMKELIDIYMSRRGMGRGWDWVENM